MPPPRTTNPRHPSTVPSAARLSSQATTLLTQLLELTRSRQHPSASTSSSSISPSLPSQISRNLKGLKNGLLELEREQLRLEGSGGSESGYGSSSRNGSNHHHSEEDLKRGREVLQGLKRQYGRLRELAEGLGIEVDRLVDQEREGEEKPSFSTGSTMTSPSQGVGAGGDSNEKDNTNNSNRGRKVELVDVGEGDENDGNHKRTFSNDDEFPLSHLSKPSSSAQRQQQQPPHSPQHPTTLSTSFGRQSSIPSSSRKSRERGRDIEMGYVDDDDEYPSNNTRQGKGGGGARRDYGGRIDVDDEDDYGDGDGDKDGEGMEGMQRANDELVLMQRTMVAEQDRSLETLSEAVRRQRDLSLQISSELETHQDLLDQTGEEVDSVGGRLSKASTKLKKVATRTKENGATCMIISLIILLLILIVIFKT